MINEVKAALRERRLILFVGAGISASLGLLTWPELIKHIAHELGYDERLFVQYGDSLVLAEYYELLKGNLKELRSWMAKNWTLSKEKIKGSEIHRLITQMDCPIIYTTNYDHCLEDAFKVWGKGYKRIVDVNDLVGISSDETQIVKFHGDFDYEKSIILTERSYFGRLDFESPLDIKLRSDMLGRSILFIGYSLSDINIRLLIYKLDQLWKKSNNHSRRPSSYLFLPVPNPVQKEILESRGIHTIVGEETDKSESILCFLRQLVEPSL